MTNSSGICHGVTTSGKNSHGRKKILGVEEIDQLRARRKQGDLIKVLMKDFSLSKASVYRYLKQVTKDDLKCL